MLKIFGFEFKILVSVISVPQKKHSKLKAHLLNKVDEKDV